MTVIINGEQDMRTVVALQQHLLDAIEPGVSTALDMTGVTAADLGFVQGIEAARCHATDLGGELCLAGPTPAAVRDVLDIAGFTNTSANMFWNYGADPR